MKAININIGLLGLGNVGCGLVDLIRQNSDLIRQRTGIEIKIKRALVRDLSLKRSVNSISLTTDAVDIINDDSIDTVVEIIGGIEPARTIVLEALAKGRHVVTANKSLIAEHGAEIFRSARKTSSCVGYEAAVCAGIPLLQALTSGLVANQIESIYGILNGTSNYILSQMHSEGLGYVEALLMAQKLGFAEPDPNNDVTGIDAAQKLAILCQLAFGVQIDVSQIRMQGIEQVDPEDIKAASEAGYITKLIATGKNINGEYDIRVHPAFIPANHPLANVNNENNAVFVKGDAVDDQMFYGKGAGSHPTASALLADIIGIVKAPANYCSDRSIEKVGNTVSSEAKYYLRFPIIDEPGVIGKLTTALGKHGISIVSVSANLVNRNKAEGQVKIFTHETSPEKIDAVLNEIGQLSELNGQPMAIRVFSGEH